MPMIPPEQTSSPSLCAARIVATFSAVVCVVQSVPNFDGAVSRLQWIRWRPAAFSLASAGSSSSPSEAQRWLFPAAARMARSAAQISST